MAPVSSSPLPEGIYRKYKASTNFFKRWLLAAGETLGAATAPNSAKDHPLVVYARIVEAVVAQPTMLTPSQLNLWPRAHAACQTAITLRERAALFFPAKPRDSHAHFLERLKEWREQLEKATWPPSASAEAPRDVGNYYAVLALPDDYFDADDDAFRAAPAASRPKTTLSAAQRKRLFDNAFMEDLNAELACLIMELEELCEGVYDAFYQIKHGRGTLVEATAVAHVAIDSAAHVIAKLQIKYPAIRTANDLVHLLEERIPTDRRADLKFIAHVNWSNRDGHRYQYAPGSMLADFLWLSTQLHVWAVKAIPTSRTAKFVSRPGMDDEMYDEDETPEYMDPDSHDISKFLVQQLPPLYTAYVDRLKLRKDRRSLITWFMSHFEDYFRTRVTSIHLVFVVMCWIRSMAAIQGERWLSRTISVSVLQRWELLKRLRATLDKGAARYASESYHHVLETLHTNIKICDNTMPLARVNPILAGCVQLECHLQYLHLACEGHMINSHFRGLCHIYNALLSRDLIKSIPFFEDALRVYEPMAFTPSREAATDGSIFRAYMVSSHVTEAAIEAAMKHRAPVPERFAMRERTPLRFRDICQTVCLLMHRDTSVIPRSAMASWRTMLDYVRDMCHKELFDTRVLSRDMLKLFDDLRDVFEDLCDTLGQRAKANARLAEGYPGQTREYTVNRAVEDSVVVPLLPLIGCLNADGTTRISADSEFYLGLDGVRGRTDVLDAQAIKAYAKKAADVIKSHFGWDSSCYFILPSDPEWVNDTFDHIIDADDDLEDQDEEDVFAKLMGMMRTSNGPLKDEKLRELKNSIIIFPDLLGMVSDIDEELCTLYHQAAGGPARDLDLVEWMNQMGAQELEPTHCRRRVEGAALPPRERRELCNELAVHSAAKAGEMDIVRIILEADHYRDLNTTTYHTRESLAHLAVKHGHMDTYNVLALASADMTRPDGAGRFVYDLTKNREWKRVILELADKQRRTQPKTLQDKLREVDQEADTKQILRQFRAEKDKMFRGIADQRDAEQELRTVGRNKSKKNGNASTSAGKELSVANLLERLQLGGSLEDEEEVQRVPVDQLVRHFQVLKDTSTAPLREKTSSASVVLATLRGVHDKIRFEGSALDTLQRAGGIGAMERNALDAHSGVLQLNKYYRQLPQATKEGVATTTTATAKATSTQDNGVAALERLAGVDVSQFLRFAFDTSRALDASGRGRQAQEILEVVERRLLKLPRTVPALERRLCVELLVEARREAKLEPATGSTPEGQRVFAEILRA